MGRRREERLNNQTLEREGDTEQPVLGNIASKDPQNMQKLNWSLQIQIMGRLKVDCLGLDLDAPTPPTFPSVEFEVVTRVDSLPTPVPTIDVKSLIKEAPSPPLTPSISSIITA